MSHYDITLHSLAELHSLYTTGHFLAAAEPTCRHANNGVTGSTYDAATNLYCTSYVCNDCGHSWTICTGGTDD